MLPYGWTESVDEISGEKYYHHAASETSIWHYPTPEDEAAAAAKAALSKVLPYGWTESVDEVSGEKYYHHAASDTSIWHHPTPEDEAAAAAKAAVIAQAERDAQAARDALAATAAADAAMSSGSSSDSSSSGSDSSSSSSSSGSSDSDDDGGAMGIAKKKKKKKKKKKQKKFVRWVFKKRDDISLSRGLLGGAAPGDLPTYLSEKFATIFADADSNGDGLISTIELMHVLKRRATGTSLDGNSLAIFALKKILAQQADHGEIRVGEWSSGLHAAIVGDPNGAVAQWILKELQDEAAGWLVHEHEGRPYYAHSSRPGETSWVRPQIIVEMERCAKLLSVPGGAGVRVPPVHAEAHV